MAICRRNENAEGWLGGTRRLQVVCEQELKVLPGKRPLFPKRLAPVIHGAVKSGRPLTRYA